MISDWARSEILNLIALPFLAVGTLANAATVQWALLRRLLIASVVVICIAVTGVLVWLVQREENIAKAETVTDKRPSPKKETPAPTPQPHPPPIPKDFVIVPPNRQAIKFAYCLVADFKGSVVPEEDRTRASIDEANFELCSQSKHDWRQVAIRIGVETVSNHGRRLTWSRWAPVVSHLRPGKSFSLSSPLNLSVASRSRDLSRAGVIIEVENRPGGTGPRNRYQLRSSS